jgi:RNA polymerase sigma factor (sigma-70 family)
MERWVTQLQSERFDDAWDTFVATYRGMLFAAIRRYAADYDDVMDVFTYVCGQLRADDMRRLRAYVDEPVHRARFTTWLVTVVHHLAIDWLRQRHGRAQPPALSASLAPIQRRIFELVFLHGRSHVEAYETLHAGDHSGLSFRQFLSELRATYAAVSRTPSGRALFGVGVEIEPGEFEPDVDADERRAVLEDALGSLSAEDRAAVELYVVNEMSAVDVARLLGWSGPKTVYNRVYRALAAIRERVERAGIRRQDL